MSKTTKSKICFKVKDTVFERDIYCVVGDAVVTLPYLKKRFGISDIGDDEGGSVWHTEDNTFVLWIEDTGPSPSAIGTRAHEVFHIVKSALDYIGVSLSDESEEVYAYYIGSIMTQLEKFVQKTK